jgi:adenine-specific DNA-methyltransferase
VTNVFLNLYPTLELDSALGGDRERMIEIVKGLNVIPGDSVLQEGRVYGGGLHKIEPKELLEVQFPTAPSWLEVGLKRQLLLI